MFDSNFDRELKKYRAEIDAKAAELLRRGVSPERAISEATRMVQNRRAYRQKEPT